MGTERVRGGEVVGAALLQPPEGPGRWLLKEATSYRLAEVRGGLRCALAWPAGGCRVGFQGQLSPKCIDIGTQDRDFPRGPEVKNLPASARDKVQSLFWGNPKCRGATKPLCHNY